MIVPSNGPLAVAYGAASALLSQGCSQFGSRPCDLARRACCLWSGVDLGLCAVEQLAGLVIDERAEAGLEIAGDLEEQLRRPLLDIAEHDDRPGECIARLGAEVLELVAAGELGHRAARDDHVGQLAELR